jgi:hypothetical protein
MAYSKEAHEILDAALKVLQEKTEYPYARMVGYLIPNVGLEDAQRIAKLVSEWEGDR